VWLEIRLLIPHLGHTGRLVIPHNLIADPFPYVMGYWFSRNSLSFLGNIGVWECLRPEWPQSSKVSSSLGFESA